MIKESEYIARRQQLKNRLAELDVPQFVATGSESIYYLCGSSYEALERPFFLIIPRVGPDRLIVPFLERDHLKKAKGIDQGRIHTYWDYPARPGRCWKSVLPLTEN